MPGESKIINKFRMYIYRTFKNSFFYKIHSGKFCKPGIPDIVVVVNSKVYFIEAKDASTKDNAVKMLRPTQIATMKELFLSNANVLLLYSNGCAKMTSIDMEFTEFSFE